MFFSHSFRKFFEWRLSTFYAKLKCAPSAKTSTINGIKLSASKACFDSRQVFVQVEGGGCSGFQYKFELSSDPLDADIDVAVVRDGVKVVVDETSLELIKGLQLVIV